MFELIMIVAVFISGIFIGKYFAPDSRRVNELENSIEEEKQQHQAYKEDIAKHFSESASLFGDITEKYRSLYEHMSSGAYELCDRRSIPRELTSSHVNILAVEAPDVSPRLTDKGTPIPEEREPGQPAINSEVNIPEVKTSEEMIVDVTRPGLSPLDQDNHSLAMQNKKEDSEDSAEVIELDSQRNDDAVKQAKDYAIKANGVINHNSLNRDDVKT